MIIEKTNILSPREFYLSAKEDPNAWESLRGRRIIHANLGCGIITSIIKVYSSTRNWCDAIFITFNNNELRFKPLDFENGQFTEFLIDRDIVIDQIIATLKDLNIDYASLLYEKYEKQLHKAGFDYRSTSAPYLILRQLLNDFHFNEADAFVLENSLLLKDRYEKIKSRFIKKYIYQSFNYQLNDEQALAIARTDQNLLVKARAGSGKTTTIAAKTSYLIDNEKITLTDIMILAFNTKAAEEIRNRLRHMFKIKDFENARTFHSLAYQIVDPKQEILFDERGEYIRKKHSEFVQKIIGEISDNAFQQKLFRYFRKELKERDQSHFANNVEYLLYRRNLRQITLNGEKVKSNGEKWIADFLFEHDIKYDYEKIFEWTRNYKPDFHLYQDNIVIEHWGIDEDDPNKITPSHWALTWEQYKEEIEAKREYWKGHPEKQFVETCIKDLENGREQFEECFRQKLKEQGVSCDTRLPENEILKRLRNRHIKKITEMFLQFIQKAKQRRMTVLDIKRLMNEKSKHDEKELIFLELANKVYEKYNDTLKSLNKIDFDDLLLKAIKIIDDTKGECAIELNRHQKTTLKSLKWIMIDEYQDFSNLFSELITVIRKYNNNIRLFCVGDDWQAINSFAGSDLEYFEEFPQNIEFSGVSSLSINHRSKSNIVESGNNLMRVKGGTPAKSLETGGDVIPYFIDDITINPRNDDDKKYLILNNNRNNINFDNGFRNAKYVKMCHKIIKENMHLIRKTENGKIGVAILCRTNAESDRVREILKSCCSSKEILWLGNFDNLIRIGTAHSFKGKEAKIVIILNVCNGSFPLIHPDNHLYEIFGQTISKVLDEERRLFYVAITRAEEKLYFLTELDNKSGYLTELSMNDYREARLSTGLSF